MSGIYYPGCSLTIANPTCSDCPPKELGRVRSIFLQRSDYTFVDIEDPNEWQTAICNKDVYVFPKTNGNFAMAEKTSEGFGNQAEDLDSYECTLTVKEPNFIGNCPFWNSIKKSQNYLIGWRTETQVYVSSVAALIVPKFEVADDIKSKVLWNLMFKFVQEDVPCPSTMPVGTFLECIGC